MAIRSSFVAMRGEEVKVGVSSPWLMRSGPPRFGVWARGALYP
jgi:hypothetical protein